jgi:hypothetical protein
VGPALKFRALINNGPFSTCHSVVRLNGFPPEKDKEGVGDTVGYVKFKGCFHFLERFGE